MPEFETEDRVESGVISVKTSIIGPYNIGKNDRWGRMRCTEVGHKNWFGDGTIWRGTYVKLSCDCGRIMEICGEDFKGKRKMKDCGCGLAAYDTDRLVLTVMVPRETRSLVEIYRVKNTVSKSMAVVELIRAGAEKLGIRLTPENLKP